MSEGPRMIPVWFFVGVILLIYGVIILATGIYGMSHPPSTVLANLHPSLVVGRVAHDSRRHLRLCVYAEEVVAPLPGSFLPPS